jgi:GNAT superfamily N-acetyltransferase
MLSVRLLTPADLPAALRLSTQAGWNQIDADWRRMIELWPGSCLAGWHEGQLVATSTLAVYGRELGWIGLVLVDEACRGRGFGGAIFDAILNKADEQRVTRLGLDATEAGRSVYLKRGFTDLCTIRRWSRPSAAAAPDATFIADPRLRFRPVPENQLAAIAAIDRRGTRLDREELLRHLARERGTRIVATETAFAVVRPGRTAHAIGPMIGDDPTVLAQALAASAGVDLFIDALPDEGFEAALKQNHFVVKRTLTRMARGPLGEPRLHGAGVFAAADFALG